MSLVTDKNNFRINSLINQIKDEINRSNKVKKKTIARVNIADENQKVSTLVSLIPEDMMQIRLVKIEGSDEEVCAGTHVSNTNEIPTNLVLKANSKGSSKVRIKVHF